MEHLPADSIRYEIPARPEGFEPRPIHRSSSAGDVGQTIHLPASRAPKASHKSATADPIEQPFSVR